MVHLHFPHRDITVDTDPGGRRYSLSITSTDIWGQALSHADFFFTLEEMRQLRDAFHTVVTPVEEQCHGL